MKNKLEKQADNKVLNDLIIDVIKNDCLKPAHVPFETLGKELIDKIPENFLLKKTLIVTDVGFLVAWVKKLKSKNIDFQNTTFLTYDVEQANFAKLSGVQVIEFSLKNLQTMYDNLKDMKFETIIGNPPFQSGKKSETDEGNGTRSTFWSKFVKLSFQLLNKDGFIAFVTPNNWRKGGHVPCSSFMWSKTLITYGSARDPIDYFPSIGHSNDVGYWLIQNRKSSNASILAKKSLLPNDPRFLVICEKFFSFLEKDEPFILSGFKGQRNYDGMIYKSRVGDVDRPYKIAGTSAQVKSGFFNWASYKGHLHDAKKVVVCDSGQTIIGFDNGTYGTGDHTAGYEVSSKEEADNLIAFLSSPIFNVITSQFCRKGSLGTPIKIFEKINKNIVKFSWVNWRTDAMSCFSFTQEELDIIESHAN